jgi:hypothetical protein
MSSASTDRSISSGISLPQWMKTRIGDRYDLDQAAFSTPSEDDSLFLIRYPLRGDSKPHEKFETDCPTPIEFAPSTLSAGDANMKRSSTAPGNQLNQTAIPEIPKENTDYGKSMASVAHNVITGKIFGSYLYPDSTPDADATRYHRQRRNSKSLPASPLASPKLSRKNPYFTDPFARPYETYDGKQSWVLSILSQRKSIEDLTANAESSASETNSPNIIRRSPKIHEPQPKPSELREMNFWSPVSM